jgi:uncharacterized protein YegL
MPVLDLVFALDGSDSLTTEQFNQMKQLVENMMNKYPISRHGTHIAVLEYSTGVSMYIPLDYSFDQNDLLAALQNLRPSRGKKVNTEKLLKFVSNVFSFRNGGRPAASKALVILTDDKPNKDLTEVAEPLKKSGVRIYVVTVGDKVSPDDFVDVVPEKSTTYPANSTDEVPDLSRQIEIDITKVVKEGK